MKRVFPILWFGFLAAFLIAAAAGGALLNQGVFLLIPVAMAAFGFFLFRKFVWDLADEVKDGGSYLVVRRGSVEERVQLADVMNVSMNAFSNPPRLSLRLRRAGSFGDEIVFIPTLNKGVRLFQRNELAEELLHRVDRLRQNGVRT